MIERKNKILEENHQQVEQLKEEADKFENHWKEIHDSQLMDCREKMKKQHELWNQQQRKLSHKTSVSSVTDENSHQKMSVNYSSDVEHLKTSLGKQKQRKPNAEQQSLVLEPILIAVANHTAKELPLEVIDEEEVDGENVNQSLSTSETEVEVDDIEKAGVSNGNEKTEAEAGNEMSSSTIIENENAKLLTMGVDTEVDSLNITTDDGGSKNDVVMSEIKNIQNKQEGSDFCINAALSAKNSINQSTDEPNVGVGKLDASSGITNSSCLRSESSTRSDSVESVSSRPKSVRFDLP